MKKTKRILSILLAAVMLLGILPASAFVVAAAPDQAAAIATTPISSVAFTMTGYELGANVADFKISHQTEGISYTTYGNLTNYRIDRINGGSFVTLTSGVFYNYEHKVHIAFTCDEGYEKAFDKNSVTLNGVAATNWRASGGTYVASWLLPNFDISTVKATVTALSADITPNDVKATVPGAAGYRFSHFGTWQLIDGNVATNMQSTTKFQLGKTYQVKMYFTTTDGYSFTADPSLVSGIINDEQMPGTLENNLLVVTYTYTVVSLDVIYVGGVKMPSGSYLWNGETAVKTGRPVSGGYAQYANGVLTLSNYVYEGAGYQYGSASNAWAGIYADKNLEIVLNGKNKITQPVSRATAIYARQNSLTISGTGDLQIDGDYGITSGINLTITGGGINVDATYGGIVASQGNVVIHGGDIIVSALCDSVYAKFGQVKVYGGSVEARATDITYDADGWAIVGDLLLGTNMMAEASTEHYGELGEYVEAKNETYDLVLIRTIPDLWVGGIAMREGDYLANGASEVTDTRPNTGSAHYANGVLTLTDYEYTGAGKKYGTNTGEYAIVYSEKDLTLVLEGDNYLTQTALSASAFYVNGNLQMEGNGKMEIEASTGIFVEKDLTVENAYITMLDGYRCMFSRSNITIKDIYLNTQATNNPITCSEAIQIDDGQFYIYDAYAGITCSNMTINGGDIYVEASTYAIGSVRGGTVTVNGGKVEVLSTNTENDEIYWAISATLNIADNMMPCAATGLYAFLGRYQEDAHNTYDRIVITTPYIMVSGLKMQDGDYLANGAADVSDTVPSGGYAYYADGILTLNNYTYSGAGYLAAMPNYYTTVHSLTNLKVVLIGTNELTQSEKYGQVIWVEGSLEIAGEGKLTCNSAEGDGTGCIIIDQDLTVNGGELVVNPGTWGIWSNGSIMINDGNITVNDAFWSGIYSNSDDVTINGGTVCVTASEYGIYGNTVTINGGLVDASSEKYSALANTVVIGAGMDATGAKTLDGDLGKYDPAANSSYCHVMVFCAGFEGVRGDVNADSFVDNNDVVALLWHTLFPETNPISGDADFTGDGVINNNDVVYLLWYTLFPEQYPL